MEATMLTIDHPQLPVILTIHTYLHSLPWQHFSFGLSSGSHPCLTSSENAAIRDPFLPHLRYMPLHSSFHSACRLSTHHNYLTFLHSQAARKSGQHFLTPLTPHPEFCPHIAEPSHMCGRPWWWERERERASLVLPCTVHLEAEGKSKLSHRC